MGKKHLIVVLSVIVVAALAYWGYEKQSSLRKTPELTATGTIEATQVDLCSKVAGTLQSLTINEEDSVKKNQIIGIISRNDLVAQKERDALGVLKAQAQLDDLVSGAREQEIEDAKTGVQIAQTNYDQAKRDFERSENLYQQGALSESEFEKGKTNLNQLQNQIDLANSKLKQLQSGSRPDAIKAARAELERSEAVLKYSEAMLEDTKITSPIDGTVLIKNFEQGEFIQAGAPLAGIANLNDMWIKVYISTDDLPKIKLGQKVKFTVSGSTAVYSGVIEEISDRGEYTPKTIQTKQERTNVVFGVKIRVNSENGVLKPGMPADVVFTTEGEQF
ncbi:MAG: HlyD family efflux transporter periplasmic adaptor subunit [Eubacteriales bacterium]|jgi:HlyD family secretion protein